MTPEIPSCWTAYPNEDGFLSLVEKNLRGDLKRLLSSIANDARESEDWELDPVQSKEDAQVFFMKEPI